MTVRRIYLALALLAATLPAGAASTLFINDISSIEGNSGAGTVTHFFADFSVRLTSPLASSLTVTPIIHDITTTRNADYSISSAPITFAPGQTLAFIRVTINGDVEPEGDEMMSVELPAPAPATGVTLGKSIGICTILDDDGAVGPQKVYVARNETGAIKIRLGSPAPSPESIGVTSTNPSIASVLPATTLPMGASSIDVPVAGVTNGTADLSVTLPASRGGRTFVVTAYVFDPSFLTFDRADVLAAPDAATNLNAHLEPPPSSPIAVALTSSNPSVASIPASFTIGTDGAGTIPIRGNAVGFTSCGATLPDVNGAIFAGFRVDVALPTNMFVTSLDKISGRATGGDVVKIFGNAFGARCVVTFGDIPSPSSQTLNAATIQAVAPPHDAGVVDVAVKCGTSVSAVANGFTYTAVPLRVTHVAPSDGSSSGGTLVRITGDNLRPGGCVASFGGVAAKTVNVNQTFDVTVSAPRHAPGTVDVTLRCGTDSVTAAGSFAYFDTNDVPATIAFSSVATAAPGDRISIGGARFRADDAIFVGGIAATGVTADQPDTRSFIVPTLSPGSAAITIRDALGRTTTGPSLTIIPPRTITIASATPAGVGAETKLIGAGFRPGLTFQTASQTLDVVTLAPDTVVLRLPASLAAGTYTITAFDGGQALATAPVGILANGVTAGQISPPCALAEGGSFATISGANFVTGALVQFGSAYSADSVVKDSKTIVAKVPPSFGVFRPVITVINPDGNIGTLTDAFVYKSAAEGCGKRRAVSR